MSSNPIKEYLGVVDDIYGVFLDCTLGFQNNRKYMIDNQRLASTRLGLSVAQLDKRNLTYGTGHPNDPNNVLLHKCTQGQLKERNIKDGNNTVLIGNLCLCQIYNYWEDYYRNRIAQYLGIEKNDLMSDIFGDLRYYRQSIIHNRGFAIKNIEKSKIILWNVYKEKIKITQDEFKEIIYYLKIYLNELMKTDE